MSKKRKKIVDTESRLERYRMLDDQYLLNKNGPPTLDPRTLALILKRQNEEKIQHDLETKFNYCPCHNLRLTETGHCVETGKFIRNFIREFKIIDGVVHSMQNGAWYQWSKLAKRWRRMSGRI